MVDRSCLLRKNLALIAPGTPLRDGLDRILRGRTGALIVLGTNRTIEAVSTGGFHIDASYSPTALRELAKMDGAIVYDLDSERLTGAGIHLMPDADIPTVESGTRHRTADRVSRQSGLPVLSVSASMSTISLFLDGSRHLVERSEEIVSRADQGLQALERYRDRLATLVNRLSTLEVEELVNVRDVALVAQRLEMVRRLQTELDGYVLELGEHGRLLDLQLHELKAGLTDLKPLLEQDYRTDLDEPLALRTLESLPDAELLDPLQVARAVGFSAGVHLDTKISARGLRQLAQINRLPTGYGERLLDHFGGLQALFGASTAELQSIDGIGEGRARIIRDGLTKLAEAAFNRQD